MPEYELYVGSTEHYDAHCFDTLAHRASMPTIASAYMGAPDRVQGCYRGTREATARYIADLPHDSAATHLARALADHTGNECVMVTRAADPDDMTDPRYRVAIADSIDTDAYYTREHNGRTWRYVANAEGPTVAWFTYRDGRGTAPID